MEVSAEMTSSPSVVLTALGTLRTQFDTLLAVEKALEEWVRKSILTAKIVDADYRLDHALTAIRAQTRAQEFNLTLSIAEAATRVYIMLMDYGDVNSKPYDKQAGDINAIIRSLTGKYAADVSTIGLSASVYELQSAYNSFDQLLKQRSQDSLQKPDKTFKEISREIEGIYHQIVTIINANAVVNTSSAFATFINHLNPEIERLNAEFHRVRYDIAHSQPEDIPEQTYTGKPVTPSTFKVLYVTPDGTVQLELGKDYNLSFKNNVEVGVAECTIHGTGRYKSSKTITFVIVRVK